MRDALSLSFSYYSFSSCGGHFFAAALFLRIYFIDMSPPPLYNKCLMLKNNMATKSYCETKHEFYQKVYTTVDTNGAYLVRMVVK